MLKKNIGQLLLYFSEISLFTLGIISIFNKFESGEFFLWTENILTLDFLAKFGVIYVVYQLLIYALFTLADSSKIDALIEIKSLANLTINCANYSFPFDDIKKQINTYLVGKRGYYMLTAEDIDKIEGIDFLIKAYESKQINLNYLNYKINELIINLDHSSEYNKLHWRNSIILRYFK